MAELRARVAGLEAENAALRTPARAHAGARRSPGRTILTSVLLVLGLLAGTAGLVTAYAKQQLLDTTNFVSTLAPLARDSAVQGVVTDAVVEAINDAVDIPALTSDVIDGIRDLGLSPRAEIALGLLEAPASRGLQSLVESSVDTIVSSDAFAATWEQALRISHTQTMATLRGEDDAAFAISDGALHLQIGPVIAEVKQRLLDNGIALADAIPAVDRSVVLVENASLEQVRSAVHAVDVAGAWLPWVSLLLLVAAVLVARRRGRSLIVAAVATAVLMASVALGIAVAGGVLERAADHGPGVVTGSAMRSIFDAATGMMSQMSVAVATLAVAVAVVAWTAGSSRGATALRSATASAARSVRSRAERRGLSTGRVGAWVDRHHRSVLVAVGVLAAAIVLLSRPLSPSVIAWTAVASIVTTVALQFVRRPPTSPAEHTAAAASERTQNA